MRIDGTRLTIEPRAVVAKDAAAPTLADLIASAGGIFGTTPDEIDAHIDRLRDEWR